MALWAEVTRSLTPLKSRPDRLHFGPLLDEKPARVPQGTKAPGRDGSGGKTGDSGKRDRPKATNVRARNKVQNPSGLTDRPAQGSFSRREMRRIDRGQQPVEARLDLHGMVQATAHVALRGFIERCRNNGLRHVLVITGKGRSGQGEDMFFGEAERGVLRRMVPLWLGEADICKHIAGFSEAPRRLGGEGALYIRLRRKNRT